MRIARWAMRLLRYDYKVHYQKGNENVVADALSRLPTPNPSDRSEFSDEKEFTCLVRNLCTIDQEEIKKETRQDPDLPRVIQCICTGWRHEEQCDKVLSTYYKLREELSSVDGLLLRGEVLVPPISLRRRLIDLAHESHPGIVRTKQRLRQRFWWPRMDIEVDTYIRDCHTCQTNDKTAVTAAAPL